MSDVMLDIETMDTHVSRSVIISLAAVRFKLEEHEPTIEKEGLFLPFDVRDQLIDGRIVSPKTQKWWSEQSAEARASALQDTAMPTYNALATLTRWCMTHPPVSIVWANGIVFDIGNLETLYLENKAKAPWEYNATRDARTIYNVLPQQREMPLSVRENVVAHDPMSDCVRQVWRLWEHWPFALINREMPR